MIGGKRRLTVYVIFFGKLEGGFWSAFCRPGFRHCLALVTVCGIPTTVFSRRFTMLVNPIASGLHVDFLWQTPERTVEEFIDAGVTAVLKQTLTVTPDNPLVLRGLFSCVTILKAVMGLRNWRIITPYGLFRFMLRNGATLIWEHGDGNAAATSSADGERERGDGPAERSAA